MSRQQRLKLIAKKAKPGAFSNRKSLAASSYDFERNE